MTRRRIHGSDVPFMAWLRDEEDTLGSKTACIYALDVDAMIHQYKTQVVDSESRRDGKNREIQSIMGIEVKARNGEPDFGQTDTIWKCHEISEGRHRLGDWLIRHFGWSFISMSGTRPDNSDTIRWGRFKRERTGRNERRDGLARFSPEIVWRPITLQILIELLGFERHPENFTKNIFRRHHKSANVWRNERTPLGFEVPVLEIKRS